MTESVRVGLVGCGGMGNEHLKILSELPGVTIAGVCDYQEERARRTAEQYSSSYWVDFGAFLNESGIDTLHICSPTGQHGDQGIAAAGKGIHILCEKPLDIDISKVDKLLETCRQRSVTLACILQRRSVPAARAVQQAVQQGKMGKIISCSISVKWWRSQEYYDKDPWRGTWQLDGGALANQGIHTLDQMVWMAGPVDRVEYAHLETSGHDIEAEDFAIAVVRFQSGAYGTIEATTCCRPDLGSRLEIFGTRGSAAFEDARIVRYGLDGEELLNSLTDRGELTGGGSDPWDISLAGHRAQIADFYAAIREGRQPMVGGAEARVSIDLLDKIYKYANPNINLGMQSQ